MHTYLLCGYKASMEEHVAQKSCERVLSKLSVNANVRRLLHKIPTHRSSDAYSNYFLRAYRALDRLVGTKR